MQILKKHCMLPKAFLCILFFSMAVDSAAQAKVLEIEKQKKTVYLESRNAGTFDARCGLYFYIELSDGDRINCSSIRSDNEWVTGKIECLPKSWDGEWGKYNCLLLMHPRYPGTANILFEDQKGRAYTVTANVLLYENPVKSLKITNINKGKNLAKMLDESTQYTQKKLVFTKKTSAPKLKVEAAKDWKIHSMSISVRAKRIDSGYIVRTGVIDKQSKTVKLKKTAKGNIIDLDIYMKNMKNGAEQYLHLGNVD